MDQSNQGFACRKNTVQNDCMKIGYIRVSTKEQNQARQIEALATHCDEVRTEQASAIHSRPVFDSVLKELKAGDTLVILDLDRAFRSTVDALLTLDCVKEQGAGFHIVNENIDTNSDVGAVIFGVLALLAEFELKTLKRRTREGLAAARSRGVRLGRPPALTPKQIDHARNQIESGSQTTASMADLFSVHRSTLSRALRERKDKRQGQF